MKQDFILSNDTAKQLYAAVCDLPIIDYHNHLSTDDICENTRFTDIHDLWIKPDPYKHRAMRMCGVKEEYITGNATKIEKFGAWWQTLAKLIGNPLYHWSMMEMSVVFGFEIPFDGKNAQLIYEKCNAFLAENHVTSKALLEKFNVEYACPCASLVQDVSAFEKENKLAPSLRGDDITAVSVEFVKKLEEVCESKIQNLVQFEDAVSKRLEYFKNIGCRYSDHALDNGFKYHIDDGKNSERFDKLLKGVVLEDGEKQRLFSYFLTFLGKEYSRLGFVLQLHIGAQRYTSTRLRNAAGAQGGFAAIGNCADITAVTSFLDQVDMGINGLPKTLLFCLNPSDNAAFSVLSGSYSKDGAEGLITQGPAWWWCDHKLGIIDVLENTAAFGVLSNFIGMTTDSRSFLSFVRHDYFRRILCDWIAKKIENDDFPDDRESLCALLKNVCYLNAKKVTGGTGYEI